MGVCLRGETCGMDEMTCLELQRRKSETVPYFRLTSKPLVSGTPDLDP